MYRSRPLADLQRRSPSWLPVLLVFSLLGTALVPLQGHTRVTLDAAGLPQVLCTWQGDSHDDQDPHHSPAFVYAQLLGGAAPSDPAALPTQPEWLAATAAAPTLPDTDFHALPWQAIRAPPLVSA